MYLSKALEILVQEWQKLHDEEETDLSVSQVVEKLNVGSLNVIRSGLKPGQIADLIESDLGQIPGALEKAARYVARFETAEELLEDTSLYGLVCDYGIPEDDGL